MDSWPTVQNEAGARAWLGRSSIPERELGGTWQAGKTIVRELDAARARVTELESLIRQLPVFTAGASLAFVNEYLDGMRAAALDAVSAADTASGDAEYCMSPVGNASGSAPEMCALPLNHTGRCRP